VINHEIAAAMSESGNVLTSYLHLLIQPGVGKRATFDGNPLKGASATDDGLGKYRWLVLRSELPEEQEEVRTRLINEGRLHEISRTADWVLYRIIEKPSSTQNP
jgi:hypothetical protein